MRFTFLLAALLVLPMTARAQDTPTSPVDTVGARITVLLVNGNRVTGIVESMTSAELRLTTDEGIAMTIPRDQVRSVESMTGRKFSGVDPNPTRLLIGPTARAVGNGKGYAALYELFFPFVAVGAGDVMTLAGGVSLIPGAPGQLIYAAPKATVWTSDGIDVAVGGFAGAFFGFDADTSPVFGIGYVVGTFGSRESAVTAGVAQGYAEGNASNVFGLLGGEHQIGNRTKLISENYVFYVGGDVEAVLSGGIRFFGDRLSTDFALFTTSSLLTDGFEGLPFVPYLGFATTF